MFGEVLEKFPLNYESRDSTDLSETVENRESKTKIYSSKEFVKSCRGIQKIDHQ